MVLGGRVHAKKGTVEVTSWGAVHHVRCKSSPAQSARRTAVTLHYSPEWAICPCSSMGRAPALCVGVCRFKSGQGLMGLTVERHYTGGSGPLLSPVKSPAACGSRRDSSVASPGKTGRGVGGTKNTDAICLHHLHEGSGGTTRPVRLRLNSARAGATGARFDSACM